MPYKSSNPNPIANDNTRYIVDYFMQGPGREADKKSKYKNNKYNAVNVKLLFKMLLQGHIHITS